MKKVILKNKKGAAIVELALVSMVLIPITLYVSFFSDVLHLRNKVDEMNYFASWELPSYKLTDYKNDAYSSAQSRFTNARNDIKRRTADIYKNFDSADKDAANPFFVMLSPQPITEGSSDFKMDEESLSGLTGPLGWLFRFNTKFVGVKSSVKVKFTMTERTKTDNTNWGENKGMFSSTSMYDDNLISAGGEYQAPEFTVMADSWALDDGSNVSPMHSNDEIKKPYRLQVQRMILFGLPGALSRFGPLKAIGKAIDTVMNVVSFGTYVSCKGSITRFLGGLDPLCARVASVNYTQTNYSGLGKDVDGGQNEFHTTPLIYYNDDGSKVQEDSEYFKTLQNRKNYYMGNTKPQCHYTGLTDRNGEMKCENY